MKNYTSEDLYAYGKAREQNPQTIALFEPYPDFTWLVTRGQTHYTVLLRSKMLPCANMNETTVTIQVPFD